VTNRAPHAPLALAGRKELVDDFLGFEMAMDMGFVMTFEERRPAPA
jgi:hypothetical protein